MSEEKKAILKEYKNLPEEEKIKKKRMEKIDITICLKKKKGKLKEYQKNYYEAKKSQ